MSKRRLEDEAYNGGVVRVSQTTRVTRARSKKLDQEDGVFPDIVEKVAPLVKKVVPLVEKVPTTTKTIKDMDILELFNSLASVVKGQEETLRRLTYLLYPFYKLEPDENKPRILPILLPGVSGVGKTLTTDTLRKIDQIGPNQFIRFPLTSVANEQQMDQILGAGPGLWGHATMETIPDLLMKAVGYTKNEPKPDGRKKVVVPPTPITPPPTIILNFEELDKAHPSFMNLLLGFMEDGVLKNSDNTSFSLPPQTRLIILFTANYGEESVLGLSPSFQYEEAQKEVEYVMSMKGISRAAVGRFRGSILPYFELPPDIKSDIKRTLLCNSMDSGSQYGYQDYIKQIVYRQEEIDIIEKRLLAGDDRSLGCRSVESLVTTFMKNLYGDVVMNMLVGKYATTPPPSLTLSYEVYDVWQYDDLRSHLLLYKHMIKPVVHERVGERMEDSMDIPLLVVRDDGGRLIHCILIDDAKMALVCSGGGGGDQVMDEQDLNLYVNIRKNRDDRFVVSVCDKPKKYNFKQLYDRIKK
jgi:hypothetical protein